MSSINQQYTANLELNIKGQEPLQNLNKNVEALVKNNDNLQKAFDGATKSAKGFFDVTSKQGQVTYLTVFNLLGVYSDLNDVLGQLGITYETIIKANKQFTGEFRAADLFNALGIGDGALKQLELMRSSMTLNSEALRSLGTTATAEFTKFSQELVRINTILRLTPDGLNKLGDDVQKLAAGPLRNLVSSTELLRGLS